MCMPGVLTRSDIVTVEIAARLWAEMRQSLPGAGAIGHARLGRLMVCLASMGMTPADRSRVAAAGPELQEPVGRTESHPGRQEFVTTTRPPLAADPRDGAARPSEPPAVGCRRSPVRATPATNGSHCGILRA